MLFKALTNFFQVKYSQNKARHFHAIGHLGVKSIGLKFPHVSGDHLFLIPNSEFSRINWGLIKKRRTLTNEDRCAGVLVSSQKVQVHNLEEVSFVQHFIINFGRIFYTAIFVL